MACDVAVFDLDGTLTRRDTSLPYLSVAVGGARVGVGVAWAGVCSLPDWVRAFALERDAGSQGLGSVYGRWEGLMHERVVARCLTGATPDTLASAAASFADRVVGAWLKPEGNAWIDAHREAGHRIVLASASLEVVLHPLADRLGMEAVVGTRLELRGGVATGAFDGLPCWGLEKLRRVREVTAAWGDVTLHAYGDSRGDEPLLQAARYPHRVG